MLKKYHLSMILLLSLAVLVLTTGCSNSNIGGGTIETTNGMVATASGNPAVNAKVTLIPEGFNPSVSDISELQCDTTDGSGAYQFIKPASGSYNIEVISLEPDDRTRALLTGADFSDKTDTVPFIQLTHPGVFIINVPDSLSEEDVFYLSGTTFKWLRSELDTTSDGSLIFKDLPAGDLPPLETSVSTVLETITVNQNDTTYFDLTLTWRSFTTDSSSIPSDNITSIFSDNSGRHWLATLHNGIGVHSASTKSFITAATLPSGSAMDLVIDKNDMLWVATTNGLYINDLQSKTNQIFSESDTGLASNNISCLALDPISGCWMGTENGLSYFSGSNWENHLSGISISDVIIDKDKNIWVSTATSGIRYYNGSVWTTYNTSSGLSDNSSNTICQRINGDIVVGHNSGKISIYSAGKWTQVSNSESGAENQPILCFYETNKGVLLAGTGGGVIKNENSFWIKTAGPFFTEIKDLRINSISDDANGNIWLGTANKGVYVYGRNADDIIFKRALQSRAL